MSDELRQDRQSIREIAEAWGRVPSPSAAGVAIVGVTADGGSYPGAAQSVYLITPEQVGADDTEGAAASFAGDAGNNLYAANIGSSVPPVGTRVVVHAVGGRWCFRHDG